MAEKLYSHGEKWRKNGLTRPFYHVAMGTWNLLQGKGPGFHVEANRIAEQGIQINEYNFEDIVIEKEKRLGYLNRDFGRLTWGYFWLAALTPVGGAGTALLVGLFLTNMPAWLVKTRFSLGHENFEEGYKASLEKVLEKREQKLLGDRRKQSAKALKQMLDL